MIKKRWSSPFLLTSVFLAVVLTGCGGEGTTPTDPHPTDPHATFELFVSPGGTGVGTVTGMRGLSCSTGSTDFGAVTECSRGYSQGTSVTLSATPNSDSTFAGWSGACSGDTCVVTMTSDKDVTATFTQRPGLEGRITDEAISGTVQGWIGEEAVVKIQSEGINKDLDPLSEGPISSDGTFSVSLPDATAMQERVADADLESYECDAYEDTGTGPGIVVTPNPLEIGEVFLQVYANSEDDEPIGYLYYVTDSGYIDLMFAPSDGTVTGSCTHTYSNEGPDGTSVTITVTDTYDLNYKAGWNYNISKSIPTEDSEERSNLNSTNLPPAGAVWRYENYGE